MPAKAIAAHRLTAVSIALAILYGLVVSPLFVYCVGTSGHREIETTACDGCGHPLDPLASDPADHPYLSPGSRSAVECVDCTDFSLTLAAIDRSDPDAPSGSPLAPAACTCPPVIAAAPEPPAAAADPPGFPDPAGPVSALLRPIRI